MDVGAGAADFDPALAGYCLRVGEPWGFPGGTSGKEPACQCRRHMRCGLSPYVGKTPWRRKWLPTPVFFTGEFHGQRSLAGYSQSGRKELDMTEVT